MMRYIMEFQGGRGTLMTLSRIEVMNFAAIFYADSRWGYCDHVRLLKYEGSEQSGTFVPDCIAFMDMA